MRKAGSYNQQYFTAEDVSKNLHLDFIEELLKQNKSNIVYANDLHVYYEDNSCIIEWAQVDLSDKDEWGSFKFVDYDQVILTEFTLPDGKTFALASDDEEKARLTADWHTEHPTWVKSNISGYYYDPSELNIDNKDI